MSLIPSHSTLVTTLTLMPSSLSFLLFSPYSSHMRNKSQTSPCTKDVPYWGWWCRDGCSCFSLLEKNSGLGFAQSLFGGTGTTQECPSVPSLAQPPSALPRDWAESAISQFLRDFPPCLSLPVLCLISCSALLGWETGIWQEGVNSQFNWVFRTKAAVAALSFWSWLTNRQFENRFLPSAQS